MRRRSDRFPPAYILAQSEKSRGYGGRSPSKGGTFRLPAWQPTGGRFDSRDAGSARPIRCNRLRRLQTTESVALVRARLAKLYGHSRAVHSKLVVMRLPII